MSEIIQLHIYEEPAAQRLRLDREITRRAMVEYASILTVATLIMIPIIGKASAMRAETMKTRICPDVQVNDQPASSASRPDDKGCFFVLDDNIL